MLLSSQDVVHVDDDSIGRNDELAIIREFEGLNFRELMNGIGKSTLSWNVFEISMKLSYSAVRSI
jgi:hypothetical protein